MNDEFENALAWFRAAPASWIKGAKDNLSGTVDWIWVVIQGDFADDASTSQMAVGTVISMIPFVDQICDVRDVIANCKKINKEPSVSWHWLGLILTLIGLFPSLGSLFKGCAKVAFASVRKTIHVGLPASKVSELLNKAVVELNKFLSLPKVSKTLKALKIDNPYKYLATQFRKLAAQINTAKLATAFDEGKKAAESMLDYVKKWGSDGMAKKAVDLLQIIDGVRKKFDKNIENLIKPAQQFIESLARRLDLEADLAHRAHLNTINPHAFKRLTEAEEEAEFIKSVPKWADDTGILDHPPRTAPPAVPTTHRTTIPDPSNPNRQPLANAHATFETMSPNFVQTGETLYRVVDPSSYDNSICWMRKSEFDSLKNKDDWRKNFAVWASWNKNGEYITYVVPPGKPLPVWEGVTASQRMGTTDYVLQGGSVQLVIHPDDIQSHLISRRKPTNWGYDDFGNSTSLVGVPILLNK